MIAEIEDNQQNLFRARRNSLTGQKAQLNEQVSQLSQQIIGLEAESKAKKQEMEIVNRELNDMKPLFEEALVAKSDITELERDLAQLQGNYSALVAEIAQNKEVISERYMQTLQLDEDRQAEILQQQQETRVNIANLKKERVMVEDQLKRLEIRAPRSGYVHNLAIHTVGGVVTPGETVTSLVPQKDLLIIEAKISPVDIEQLFLSQEARLRLPSFEQKTTPELKANLATISADLLQDELSGEMYYQAKFIIPEVELDKLNGKTLIPGMPVEVFATTEDRTVLSYLIKPIRDQIAHALRER